MELKYIYMLYVMPYKKSVLSLKYVCIYMLYTFCDAKKKTKWGL